MYAPTSLARSLALVLVSVAVTAGAGCATSGYPGLSPQERQDTHVAIRVRNDNWHDMRIYLVLESGAAPRRIGNVPSFTTGILRIPYAAQGMIRLQLRPIGTRATHVTQPIFVEPGRSLQLNVANALAQSILIVR